MHILKAFCLAFSTYSRIPMIRVYPNKENMRYMMCYLPFVGAAVGALFMLWFHVCVLIRIDHACFSAVAAVLSGLVTGGIHARGYLKTNDALSSYGSKQKMLEILREPHVGAFAIITAIVYYILYFGFLNEISIYGEALMISLGFVLSRSLCALLVSLMRCAQNKGILYEVSSNVNKSVTVFVSVLLTIACVVVMAMLSAYIGFLVFLCQAGLILYYKFFVAKKMGGITNDTCGYYIQMSELLTVMAVVIGLKIIPFLPTIPIVSNIAHIFLLV